MQCRASYISSVRDKCHARLDGLAALAETAAEYADALTEVPAPGVLTTEAIIPNAQGLANALWAMAKTGTRTPDVFEAICAEASRKVQDCNAQEIANTLRAMTKTGTQAPDVFEALCTAAAQKV